MGSKLKESFRRTYSFFLDCISFNTPRAIVFNITSILLALLIIPTEKLGYSPFKCVFKNIIFPIIFMGNCPVDGIFIDCNCPGCGLTRSLSSLLHGNIGQALDFNILVIPLFITMIVVLVINIIKIVKEKKEEGSIFYIQRTDIEENVNEGSRRLDRKNAKKRVKTVKTVKNKIKERKK